jgi:hypothetical protein
MCVIVVENAIVDATTRTQRTQLLRVLVVLVGPPRRQVLANVLAGGDDVAKLPEHHVQRSFGLDLSEDKPASTDQNIKCKQLHNDTEATHCSKIR